MKLSEFEQILNELKVIKRRLDSLEKYAELQHNEREILEDIRVSQTTLKEIILNHRTHTDNKIDDVKGEIIEQGLKTEEKLEQVQEKTEDTKDKIEEVKEAITNS